MHFHYPTFSIDLAEFTDEEGYGKYLDLHQCYEKFINLKGIEVGKLNRFEVYFSCNIVTQHFSVIYNFHADFEE
jgi:hypothetical protein